MSSASVGRNGQMHVVYRLDSPASGRGVLHYSWTDALGRVAQRGSIPVVLTAHRQFAFTLDLRHAAAMANRVRVHLSVDGATQRAHEASASFISRPNGNPWSDWQLIIYQNQTPAQLATLKRIGVTAGRIFANRNDAAHPSIGPAIAPFLAHDLRWYVENIATDFYAAYHRWQPNLPVNVEFLKVQRLHAQNPNDPAAFIRVPSLSDPAWLRRVGNRIRRAVHDYAAYRPLYYSLADEPGIADLAAAWDFDLSPASLRQMRVWLAARYGSLAALNREWGRHFSRWRDVVPSTTDQAMRAAGDNFAAWADFKAWMDVAFARAIRAGTDAVHAADPHALAAIEGGQVPGWGGYDYARLAGSVDAMELYDAGDNIDILHSLSPSTIMLMTLTGGNPEQIWALWRGVMRGMRGAILWDPNHALVHADGSLGPWGRAAAPTFAELRGGLGALLASSPRAYDAVALLYSPASQRTQWMLDHRPQGTAWAKLGAEAEYRDNPSRQARRSFASAVARAGLQARFLTTHMVETGALRKRVRVLLLPDVLALSTRAANEIRRFVANGGTVIADVVPGAFDQHSRRRPHPALEDLFRAGGVGHGRAVLVGRTADLSGLLPPPAATLSGEGGDTVRNVAVYRYRTGTTILLALQRAAPPASGTQGIPGEPQQVVLHLRHRYFIYEVRKRQSLGYADTVTVPLGSIAPTVLALSPTRLSAPILEGPTRMVAGQIGTFAIRLPGGTQHNSPVHIAVSDPNGDLVPAYSGNLSMRNGHGAWHVPLAFNDPVGNWRIRITDVVNGKSISHTFAVTRK